MDSIKNSDIIINNIQKFVNTSGHKKYKISVFVLTNYDSTFEEDLERIYLLRDIGVNPYVMIYEKEKTNCKDKIRLLQRYVNNKFIFNVVSSFDEYDPKKYRKAA